MDARLSRRGLLAGGAAAAAIGAAPEASAQPGSGPPKYRLGLVTYNVARDWDLPTILSHCRAAGVAAVEFRTTHRHGVEPSLSAAQRQEVRQRCADAGIAIWGLGTVCEFQSPDPAVVRQQIETCRAFVELARDLGARGVKVRPNGLPAGVPVAKTLEQIGLAVRECAEFARAAGVEIWVEVHGSGTQQPENMRQIMEVCHHPAAGICWNSNPTDVKDGSVAAAFELLRPFLKSVHINTLWGAYPYRELFTLLRGAGYDRYTLCEVGSPINADSGTPFLQCYHGLWRALAGA